MQYAPTLQSLKTHQVPPWYQGAKLGIFIHWGLYSVPAFAPVQYGDITKTVGDKGFKFHFAHNPYAEWYLNSLRVKGQEYIEYHKQQFGTDFPYENFTLEFNNAIGHWKPQEWAKIFKQIGVRYVVLTTKHHDGFCLWPTKQPNPSKGTYHAERNLVGELTEAVRSQGIRMGLYYSGGLDWTFNPNPILETTSMLANSPRTSQYGHYVDNHFRELIDQFQPSVLWNDIAYPIEGNLKDLIAYYYNTISDGVVNDRWTQIPKVARFLEHSIILKYIINKIAQKVVKSSGFEGKPPRGIGDYCTPEYAPSLQLHSYKWECCRGIGRSFGFNRMETAEHYLSNETLIHSFIDIVSKNGNLLLNIGPQANGEIPPLQKERLLALGNWLTKFGGAIFDTSPWSRPTAITREQTHIRFTTKGKDLFLIVLRPPRGSPVIIPELKIHPESKAFIGDTEDRTQWRQIGSELELQEPNLLDEEYAYTIRFQNALLD